MCVTVRTRLSRWTNCKFHALAFLYILCVFVCGNTLRIRIVLLGRVVFVRLRLFELVAKNDCTFVAFVLLLLAGWLAFCCLLSQFMANCWNCTVICLPLSVLVCVCVRECRLSCFVTRFFSCYCFALIHRLVLFYLHSVKSSVCAEDFTFSVCHFVFK